MSNKFKHYSEIEQENFEKFACKCPMYSTNCQIKNEGGCNLVYNPLYTLNCNISKCPLWYTKKGG